MLAGPDRRDVNRTIAAKAKTLIDQMGITPDTAPGLIRAYEVNSSFRILVGVGVSEKDHGAKHLIIELQEFPKVQSSHDPGNNIRQQFRLNGEPYREYDPVFLGFADFGPPSPQYIELVLSGKLRDIPCNGLSFFPGVFG